MQHHIKYHRRGKIFKCEICDKAFRDKWNLNNHRTTHSDDHPFKCDICDKALKNYSALRSHQRRVHPDKKSFQCEVCDKALVDLFSPFEGTNQQIEITEIQKEFQDKVTDNYTSVAYTSKQFTFLFSRPPPAIN